MAVEKNPKRYATFPPEVASVAAARRFVGDTLRNWGVDEVDDAMLLTSELVTNAIVHAGTEVEVVCEALGGQVRIEVHDRHQARRIPVPGDQVSGRGLLFPETLAITWGVTYGQGDKQVWFTVPGTAGETPGAAASRVRGDHHHPAAGPADRRPARPPHRTDRAGRARRRLRLRPAHRGRRRAGPEGDLRRTARGRGAGVRPRRASGRRPWRLRRPGRQPVQPARPAGRRDPVAGHRAVRHRRPGDRAVDRRLAGRRALRRGRRRAPPAGRRPPGALARTRPPDGAGAGPARLARLSRRGEQPARRHPRPADDHGPGGPADRAAAGDLVRGVHRARQRRGAAGVRLARRRDDGGRPAHAARHGGPGAAARRARPVGGVRARGPARTCPPPRTG